MAKKISTQMSGTQKYKLARQAQKTSRARIKANVSDKKAKYSAVRDAVIGGVGQAGASVVSSVGSLASQETARMKAALAAKQQAASWNSIINGTPDNPDGTAAGSSGSVNGQDQDTGVMNPIEGQK